MYMKITTGLAQIGKHAEFNDNHRMNKKASQIYTAALETRLPSLFQAIFDTCLNM